MKPSNKLRAFFLGSTLLASVSTLHAIDYYWDSNGATDGFGTTDGTWGTSAFFSTGVGSELGNATPTAATTTTSDTLNIGTADLAYGDANPAITINGTQNIGSIIIGAGNAAGVSITGGTGLNFAATGTVTNNDNNALVINSKITGAATALDLYAGTSGGITLSLNGNTYTGITNVRTGLVTSNGSDRLGATNSAATKTVVFSGGRLNFNNSGITYTEHFDIAGTGTSSTAGALSISGGNTVVLSRIVTLTDSATVTQTGSGSMTFSGGIALGANALTFNSGTNQIVQTTAISGASGSIIKIGAGALNLNVANTFSGGVTINAGNLVLGNAGALNSTAGSQNAVTFGASSTGTLTLNGNSVTIANLSTNATPGTTFVQNNLAGTATLTVGNASNLSGTYAGTIQNGAAGTLALTKTGSGTLTLSGDNSYTGATNVNGGTLTFSGNRTVGTAITVGGTSAVLNVSNGDFASAMTIGNATGAGEVFQTGGKIAGGGNAHLLGTSGSGNGTYNLSAGELTVTFASPASATSSRGVMLGANTGSGTFNLSGTGNLNLANGALLVGRFDADSSGADGTFNQTGGTATIGRLAIGGGITTANNDDITSELNLSGGIFTAAIFNVLSGSSLSNVSTINISGTADVTLPEFPTNALGTGSSATITFDGGVLKNSAASTNYLGNITSAQIKNGGAKFNTTAGDITITHALDNFSGATGTFTKEGANKLTLSGTNTYTGATTVSDGSLIINGSTHISSTVTVASDATLGGSGTVGGNTIIHGTHNPGNSPGIQTFTSNLSYAVDGSPSPVVNWELNDNTTVNLANPDALFDQIIVGGNLNFEDPTALNLFFNSAGSEVLWENALWNSNQSWLLYDVTGTTSGFDNLILTTSNWADKDGVLFNTARADSSFMLTQNGEDIFLNYNVIPEPSAALLGSLGMFFLLRRRRA